MKKSNSGKHATDKTENSVYLHEATQSVVISRSSFDDNANHDQVTARANIKSGIHNAKTDDEEYKDINNFETVAQIRAQAEDYVESGSKEQNQEEMEEALSKIFVWGDNSRGQLAIACSERTQLVPDPVAINLNRLGTINQVACGVAHTVFLSDSGFVFAMGDNSHGQLGFPTASSISSSQPMMVSGVSPRPGKAITSVFCANYTSFAVVSADLSEQADELYSWGSSVTAGVASLKQAPKRVEFPEAAGDNDFKIKMMSAGADHAAIVTNDYCVYVWGDNSFGQLGLGDNQRREIPVINNQVVGSDEASITQVSCGKSFSFLISGHNEILVSGRLPFTVQNEEGAELDYIVTFQSIAQFDQRVKILQVEASRFASLVVDPVEDGQPRELFFWGQSPLGVFNELTPLNQLFGSSGDSTDSSTGTGGQSFNVKAVRNGLNFCIFIEQDSGMTYQIGAENLIDPYIDDALVSLSELRDAQFNDADKFACGSNFVIGESLTSGAVLKTSPMKRINESHLLDQKENRVSAFKPSQSPVKNVIEEDPTAEEMSMKLVSPGGESKQSFPQRALYAGSISPSTPTDANQSIGSYSGTKSMKLQHKVLATSMKNMAGCMPILSETPKACHHKEVMKNFSDHENSSKEAATSAVKDYSTMALHEAVSNKDRQFNKTSTLADMKTHVLISDLGEPEASIDQGLAKLDGVSIKEEIHDNDSQNPDHKPAQVEISIDKNLSQANVFVQANVPEPISEASMSIITPSKQEQEQVRKPEFSPGVSPIVNMKMQEQASSISRGQTHQQCWMQMVDVKQQSPFLRADDNSFHHQQQHYRQQREDSCQKLASQLPLQMQPSQHYVYQSYTQPPTLQATEDLNINRHSGNISAVARFLPVQQQAQSVHSTPQRSSNPGYPTFHNNAPVQMSYQCDQSGFLNMSQQHVQHLAEQQLQQSVYHEMVLKEKIESSQLQGQLKEAQRQLEKSRKEYAKLLSQVDEDQEETSQFKTTVRKQAAQISEMTIKQREQDLAMERLFAEKNKLDTESHQANKANQSMQTELSQLYQQIKTLEEQQAQAKLEKCTNERCLKNEQELELSLQKRSKQIYDLTVKLGCLQTENTELKSQLDERNDKMEKRLDSSRILIEQELQEACEQIRDLSEAFSLAQDQLLKLEAEKNARSEVATQTTSCQFNNIKKKSKAIQVGHTSQTSHLTQARHSSNKEVSANTVTKTVTTNQEDEIPKFIHSHVKEAPKEVVFEMPAMPLPTFEVVNQQQYDEVNQSFEASISFVQQENQDSSSFGCALETLNDNSLREFKQLEQARQSMELPRLFNLPMAVRSVGSMRNGGELMRQQMEDGRHQSEVRNYITVVDSQEQEQKQPHEMIEGKGEKSLGVNGPSGSFRNQQPQYDIETPRAEPAASNASDSARGAKKHNFMGNRSNASIEPKIIRNGSAAGRRTGFATTSQSSQKNSREHSAAKLNLHNYKRIDLNHQEPAVKNANTLGDSEISCPYQQTVLTIDQLDAKRLQDEEEVNSWQTFKPMATETVSSSVNCPNDRYSLKRHQEIFENQQQQAISCQNEENQQRFDTQQRPKLNGQAFINLQSMNALVQQKLQKQPQSTKVARRAKSNADLHSSNGAAQAKKMRRMRHQRKAEAKTKHGDGNSCSQDECDNDDDASHRSAGVKSNMTTPLRGNQTLGMSTNGIKRDSSRLQQPTPVGKSAAVKATLSRIDSQSKISGLMADDLVQYVMSTTSRNSQKIANMMGAKTTTPKKPYETERKLTIIPDQTYKGIAKTARATAATTSNLRQRHSTLPNKTGIAQNHSYTNLNNVAHQNRSVTPRINKSMASLHPNAQMTQNSRNSLSSANNQQQLSATARRVAYEQRRKLAQQTMKQMKLSSQRTNTEVNRQARAAVASLPVNAMSISLEEQPYAELPQQASRPIMSICEDSVLTTLPSARNAISIQDMSPIVAEIDAVTMSQQPSGPINTNRNEPFSNNHQTLQTVSQQQTNPFLATPVPQDNSLTRETFLSELRKSKTALSSQGPAGTESIECRASMASDKDHLHSMKQKLFQIQSNKNMLESKIKDYETQLLRISHEPATQEIMAKFRHQPRSSSLSGASAENQEHNVSQSCSEYTLGESGRVTIDKRSSQTPQGHTFSTQERNKKRTAFQPLQNNHNQVAAASLLSNSSASFNSTIQLVAAKPYRECMTGPPQLPQRMMKAPPSVQPRTHYKNAPIFKR